jgi:hypothetical protein
VVVLSGLTKGPPLFPVFEKKNVDSSNLSAKILNDNPFIVSIRKTLAKGALFTEQLRLVRPIVAVIVETNMRGNAEPIPPWILIKQGAL